MQLSMNKKIYFFIIIIIGCFCVKSQTLTPPKIQEVKEIKPIFSCNFQSLSPTTAFLVTDLVKGEHSLDYLIKNYPIAIIDNKAFVFAFIELQENVKDEEIKKFNIKKSETEGCMLSVQIPLEKFLDLVQSEICSYIDIGIKNDITTDSARSQTNVEKVYTPTNHLQSKYTGEGVVVGIIDIGFEYGHPNFYDSTGNIYRVKRVWEQNTNGTHPQGFNYGRELTSKNSILAANCSEQDETHGTHVAGIATGSGGTISPRKYRGMAPLSDIVLVATKGYITQIYDGINYIYQYASSVNKPCVINISWGSTYGSHDGTSSFDRQCDSYTTLHPQGLILVGSAGNSGSDSLHISKIFNANDSILYTFLNLDNTEDNNAIVDIWGVPNINFSAGVGIVNTNTRQFEDISYFYNSSTNNNTNISLSDNDNTPLDVNIYSNNANYYNNRPRITFRVDNSYQNNNRVVCVVIKTAMTDTIHVWSRYCTFTNKGVQSVTAGDTEYTISEIGGTGKSMISVGSYVSKRQWKDYNQHNWHYTNTTQGNLSNFSSKGPTLDNRTKPDISAPGQGLCSSLNRYNTSYITSGGNNVSQQTFNGNTEYFGMMSGTSMAAPTVAGIIALWLEKNPYLTINQVKTLIKESTLMDNHTGVIDSNGNNSWGHGKINALGIINIEQQYNVSLSVNNPYWGSVTGAGLYYEGDTVTLVATANNGYSFVNWSDGDTTKTKVLIVTSDTSFVANFEPQTPVEKYITLTVEPGEEIYFRVATNNDSTGIKVISGSSERIFSAKNINDSYNPYNDSNHHGCYSFTPDSTTMTICGDIKYLYCFNNSENITSIDASHNTSLRYIYCFGNNITNLDVSTCTNLSILDCANNLLENIDISNTIYLEKLLCNNNRLTNLNISNNQYLKSLICYQNYFSTSTLDKIYCLLRNTSSSAFIAPTDSPSDDIVLATNKSNATSKGWKLKYYNATSDSYIEFPETYGQITCEQLLNLPEIEQNEITLYPNPADKEIIIIGIEDKEAIIILDNEGKMVKQTFSKNHKIDISDLKSGVYYVLLQGKSIKLIKA